MCVLLERDLLICLHLAFYLYVSVCIDIYTRMFVGSVRCVYVTGALVGPWVAWSPTLGRGMAPWAHSCCPTASQPDWPHLTSIRDVLSGGFW